MPDFPALLEWAMAIIALLATGGLIYWVTRLVPRGRLMRCPETERITFVEVERASPEDSTKPRITVRGCDLWPEHSECGRGCLAREGEAASGFPTSLHALRPFNRK